MGIYFRKSIKIAPGLRLNVSKGGTSVSIGPRGAKLNIGKRGTYVTTGIPGTGIYSRTKISGGNKKATNAAYSSQQLSDAERFAKADPVAQGCGLFAGCMVGALGLWIITGKFVAFVIMAIFGVFMAFLPSLFASNKKDSMADENLNSQDNLQDDTDIDVQYSKPIIEQVNALLEKMDISETESELLDIHTKISNLMNEKLRDRKILFNGLSFDEALKLIDEEYQKKLEIVQEINLVNHLSKEETSELENCLDEIERSSTTFEALNAYDKAKIFLKQFEEVKGIIYKGMNYAQLFEATYQVYVNKCKELNKK